MSTVTLDSRPHIAAIRAAIKAEIGPNNVYEYGQVPGADGNAGTLPNIFVLVAIERRYNPTLNLAAKAGATGWRVSARAVGRTVDEARWALFKVATALNEQRLTIEGRATTPLQFESDRTPEKDDGRFSGVAMYTYAH